MIEVEVKIQIPDRLYKILEASGKLALIEEWALEGLKAMAEALYLGDLVGERNE